MEQELLTYILIIIGGGALSLCLCIYALFRFRQAPGGRYYIVTTFLASVFNFAYLFELTSPTLEQTWFWLRMEYIPLPFIPAFTLLMCCDYVGQKLHRWVYYVLFLIPLATILMQHTNEYHHLYYSAMSLSTDTPFPVTRLVHGPYFYVHSVYLYGCLALSILILLLQMRRVRWRFRMQILTMVAGLIAPVVASFFYVGGKSPYGIDLGPFFISVSFIFHSIALLRYQMFDVAPIARDIVFESMEDGVVVLNENGVLVDYNNAMTDLLEGLDSRAIGMPLMSLLDSYPVLREVLVRGQECDYECERRAVKTYFRIRFAPVRDRKGTPVGRIIIFANITEQAQLEEQLKHLANTDGLTQLLNKTALMQRSEQVIEGLSRQDGGPVAVIMFDIDQFKQVNDTYGHEAGDIALMHLAATAREILNEQDIAGRYGGDEFIICMPGASVTEAYELAELIRSRIAGSELLVDGETMRISSSFGVASVQVTPGDRETSVQQLIRQADQALYAAKRMGRNCVQVYG
ncbi:histidine kinase N-terminal 7TM domain-containing diguanylate cyclase [Paenibacillus wulumuqiensis]|uniref:histidine kinase N-terminal 7TM domain-containing diguanylate cyclase n=1 Tax=Paenibacillus wulumuqiensis TaxID=1567107 RepID=UPI000619CCC9|nr:histidine kinase N-terminal 7TM domain-containing protein [Paenibacillus wulumuqiensis]